jgi:elongation factor G
MKTYRPDQIRNVGLFGHGGSGKTSLSEAILFTAGVISRLGKVEEGTTTSDYDPDEIRRRISVNLSMLPFDWHGIKVNLIDTPGYFDFIGEAISAMRVVDGAVIVVDAVAGVEVGTEMVWKLADERGLPRVVFVNKVDRENADFWRAVESLTAKFGRRCIPVQLPVGSQADFKGVVDLVALRTYDGANPAGGPVPAELSAQVQEYREKLVEAVVEADDELLNKYLEGEELTAEELDRALTAAVRSGQVVPVLVGSALLNRAVAPLIDFIVKVMPSPVDAGPVTAQNLLTGQEEALDPLPTSPLAALVFKTTADPYVGRLNYFRVYAGVLRSDSHVWNATKGRDERVGQVFFLRGKHQEPTAEVIAGDIAAVAKLAETSTGDTLATRDRPLLLPGISFPEPSFYAAVHPKTQADLDKLGPALTRLVEEDPTLRIRREPDTNEILLGGMGESHIDVAVDKLKRKFGVEVRTELPKVPYKETITRPVKAEHKHKKQTGGRGQYGHVFLELEPLPRGSGFEFQERIFGGAVPKEYIPAVEKGVRAALQEGVLARFPVVDVRVTLYDGSYHPVDSSDISFQIAGREAFKKGMAQANPVLLEPIMRVRVTVPDEYTGDVMGDLNTRRGRVLGMSSADGKTTIEALVPYAEMRRYATELRSMTQARGTFEMEFSHYEEVPPHLAQQIIAEAARARVEREAED